MTNKQINIIIVDDNPAFRKGVATFLRKVEKYEIIAEFNSGIELLEYPDLHHVNLVLLDIELPGINGLEIAKRLNFVHPDIIIIAITMYQDSLYIQQLVESGFRAYVNKMDVPELLLSTIEATLQNRFVFPTHLRI